MANHTFIELHLKETKYLADLNGIVTDLQNTIEFCRELQKCYGIGTHGRTLIDILSTAILVRYCRSFVSGFREKINLENIKNLSSDEKKSHNFYMNLRNMHIAHSINDLEENKVIAFYIKERLEEGFQSISVQHCRVIGLNSHDLDTIISLCHKFIEHIDTEIENEKSKLLKHVRQLPMNNLLSCGMGSGFNPKMNRVHKRRKQ